MTTIKSYTDLEQSKKLKEVLPLESADMYYSYYHNPISGASYYEECPIFHIPINKNKSLPCWSLAALLYVLPSATLDSSDDHHYRVHCNEKFTDWYDNPVDACVAMVEKLHEQMIYDFNNI